MSKRFDHIDPSFSSFRTEPKKSLKFKAKNLIHPKFDLLDQFLGNQAKRALPILKILDS